MHPSKAENRFVQNRKKTEFKCVGICNKQDASTLDPKVGLCPSIMNIDLANTNSSRQGYVATTPQVSYDETSDQSRICINDRWVSPLSLGHVPTQAEFKVATSVPSDTLLEFYNGRLYMLVPNTQESILYCSDPWDIDTMDERQCVVAIFPYKATALGRTDNGLVVGTEREVFFLSGSDAVEGGFTQKTLAYYGAIRNTLVRTSGHKLPVTKMQGRVCIFTTQQGICVVDSQGSFLNLSLENVSFNWGNIGAAFLREKQGQIHYVVSMNTSVDNAHNKETNNVEILDNVET